MKKTLLAQVYPTYLAPIVACLTALALVTTTLVASLAYSLAHDELRDIVSLVERRFFPDGRTLSPETEEELARLFTDVPVRVTIIAPEGKVLADSQARTAELENHRNRPEVAEALERGEGNARRFSSSVGAELIYLAKSVGPEGAPTAVIRASKPLPVLQERLAEFYGHLAFAGIAILAASAVLAYASVRRINRPLVALAAAARRIGAGDFSYRTRIAEPEEIRTLSDTIDTMAEQLGLHIADVERRRREAEAILSGMAEGVIVLDKDFRIAKTNESAKTLLGGPGSGDPVGKTLLEAFRSSDLHRFAREAMEGSGPVEGTLTIYAREQRILQVYAALIGGREGGGCLLVVHDITRLAQLENVRRDFVANVSHELKTPITSIKGFVETLADGALDDPVQARRFLDIIAKHTDRLEDIIEDLLALARLEQQEGLPLETERLPLALLLENSLQVCERKAHEKGMEVAVVCPEDLAVSVNPTLLEQAFVNLIDNAVKYSPAGSPVRVEAERIGEEAVVRVIDRGRGIPAKDLPRIFERFYRVDKARGRDAGGTGLGLAIVKHVAAVHGGAISVESWEGEGSVFSFRFPVDASGERAGRTETADPSASQGPA